MPDPTTAYATAPVQLTSKDEIQTEFGAYGVEVLDAEATTMKWERSIARASDTVILYCQKHASVELLAANRWARGCATVLGCYYMSGFAGEPHNGTFDAERDEVLEQLKAIQAGEMDIPNIAYTGTENKEAVPVGSNLAVDLTRLPCIRVVEPASTGMPRGTPRFPFFPARYPRFPNG